MPDEITSRRSFLAGSVAGLGAALSAGEASAQVVPPGPVGRPAPQPDTEPPLPPEQRVEWAVAGLGHYAQSYVLPALTHARRSRLVALVSGNAEKGRGVAARYGIAESRLQLRLDGAARRR